jgi:hypothetical protein
MTRKETPYGRGMTLMKTTSHCLILVLLVVSTVLVGCQAATGSYNLAVSLTEQGIHVKHDKMLSTAAADFVIPFGDVQAVQVFSEAPKLKKTNGLNNAKALIGKFTAESIGNVTVYAVDYKAEGHKFVSVTTKDATYIFSPAAPDEFANTIKANIK